jgi:heat shock protein HslJ
MRTATTWARPILVLLACAALTAGCGDDESGGTGDDPTPVAEDATVELEGQAFVADRVTGHEIVDGSVLNVAFEDGVMAVAAGCNTMFGAYVAEGGALVWKDEPASTMMACDAAHTEQDAWLTTLFTDGLTIEEDDAADLVLTSGAVRIELTRRT